jgi:hypothetical protein
MITVSDVKQSVKSAYKPSDWFLICLRDGGWQVSAQRGGECIRMGERSIRVTRLNKQHLVITVVHANYTWNSENLSVHLSELALRNTVEHLLRTAGFIQESVYD